jgi:hypothetical protein
MVLCHVSLSSVLLLMNREYTYIFGLVCRVINGI